MKCIYWLLWQTDIGINITQSQNCSNLIFVYSVLIKSASVHANALAPAASCEYLAVQVSTKTCDTFMHSLPPTNIQLSRYPVVMGNSGNILIMKWRKKTAL